MNTGKPAPDGEPIRLEVEPAPGTIPILGAAGRLLVGLVMVTLCIAGAAKLWDLPAFQRSLLTWRNLPDWAVGFAWFGLPAAESLVAVLWGAGIRRRACERTALALLAAMCVVVAIHWARGESPTCNCIGALTRYLDAAAEIRVLLARAMTLLAVMFVGHLLLVYSDRHGPAPCTLPKMLDTRRRGPGGFTLVETLVSITVIAVLIALLIAGISGVIKASRQSKTVAYLGQHGSVLSIYASD